MADAAKKKGVKTLRKPPVETDLDAWVTGSAETTSTEAAPRKTKASARAVSSAPTGAGIVQRADGGYKRRLVVYLDPEHATQLKVQAARHGRDMSDIVDELVGQWLSGV